MSTSNGQWIVTILAVLAIGCASRQHVAFTVIQPEQGILSTGGGSILNDFTPEIVQREAADAKIFYDQCRKAKNNCGTYIAFHYDDTVNQAELEEAITVTVAAFRYAQPIYVRAVYDDHPRRVAVYAIVSVGQIELLP